MKTKSFIDIKYFLANKSTLKPRFHIVVSDGDMTAMLRGHTDLNFSHLDWDVGDTTGTLAKSPKKRSHIIVSVPVASPFH